MRRVFTAHVRLRIEASQRLAAQWEYRTIDSFDARQGDVQSAQECGHDIEMANIPARAFDSRLVGGRGKFFTLLARILEVFQQVRPSEWYRCYEELGGGRLSAGAC